MTNTSVTMKTYKGTSTISRAKFGPGMLLQHEDLEQLNSYTRDLSRLLFRSFFGCGVICGLTVKAQESCGKVMATVGAGMALNCTGDPIYVPKDQTFAISDDCDPNIPTPLWVVLCATTRCCAPRNPVCGCDDDGEPAACTRETDGYEIRVVRERPECACGCPEPTVDPAPIPVITVAGAAPATDPCQCADPKSDCYKDHYGGICGCDCEDSNCVLLGRLDHKTDATGSTWTTEYRVRRFIRPVLVRDPLAYPDPSSPAATTGTGTPGQLTNATPVAKTAKKTAKTAGNTDTPPADGTQK